MGTGGRRRGRASLRRHSSVRRFVRRITKQLEGGVEAEGPAVAAAPQPAGCSVSEPQVVLPQRERRRVSRRAVGGGASCSGIDPAVGWSAGGGTTAAGGGCEQVER